MTLVDSSVWIDFLNGVTNDKTTILLGLLREGDVITGDLIVAEIFQGFRHKHQIDKALNIFGVLECVNLVGEDAAFVAAERFRTLRKKGHTVRKTVDALIASYCITEGIPLLYIDRDFSYYVKELGLVTAE